MTGPSPRSGTDEAPVQLPIGGWLLSPTLPAELLEQSLQVAPTLDMRDIGARLLAPLVHATNANRASVMIVNPSTGRLRVVAGTGIRPEIIGRDAEWRPNSISEWVYRKRQGLVLNGEIRGDQLSGSAEEAIESALCVPLETGDGVLGVLNLARRTPAPVFTEDEMNELRALLWPVAAALERAVRARHAEDLANDLRYANGMTGHSLLKPGLLESRHYEFGFARVSSALLGGDVCERVPHPSGTQSVMMADVDREGAQAVLTTGWALGHFVGSAGHERSPAAFAARLNADLVQRQAHTCKIAMWSAMLSPNGQITTCAAGYAPPLWIPLDDSPVVHLASGGPKLGEETQGHWDEEQVRLLPGDLLIAVSDGVLQSRNVTGQPFGQERLIERSQDLRRHSLDSLAQDILRAARDWSGRDVPTDDMLVLAIRYRPGD